MALEAKEIAAEAKKVAKAVKKILLKLKGIHGGFSGIRNAAPTVVEEVEKAAKSWAGITGADKKAMAVAAICELIPNPTWFPEWVERIVIGWAIERALKEYKKRTGKR